MNNRIIPVLLFNSRGLVKGVRFKQHKYVGDPINAVRVFNEKRSDEIILLNIDGTTQKRTVDIEFVQKVADEAYMPFAVGGGVSSVEDFRLLIRAGAEKVTVNTAAVERPELIREASTCFGAQSVIVAIDVKNTWLRGQRVVTHCGCKVTGLDPIAWALRAQKLGAGEILLTSVDRDGTGQGYDLELTRRVSDALTIPVIACGGAGNYGHMQEVVDVAHASAAAAGSMFVFHGEDRSVMIQYPSDREGEFRV